MIVKELIEKLREVDDSLEVFMPEYNQRKWVKVGHAVVQDINETALHGILKKKKALVIR